MSRREFGRLRVRTVFTALAIVFVGCGPSQEQLDAARAKARDLQSQLNSAQKKRQELDQRLQDMRAENDDLKGRLESLGQSLEQVRGEKKTQQERIAELQKAVEEFRKRQKRAKERAQMFCNVMKRFREMIESGRLKVHVRNNRMIVELPEGVLFDSGRAQLKDEGEKALKEVAGVLQDIPERHFQVAGHTDNVPINTRRFPSNWELSAKRAVNVTRFLVDQGLNTKRLSAAGYSKTQPVASNETEKGRQKNRRIEIVLVPNLDELPDLSELEARCE